jgi:hypothetical protein
VQNKNISKPTDVAITKCSAPKIKVKIREEQEANVIITKFFPNQMVANSDQQFRPLLYKTQISV